MTVVSPSIPRVAIAILAIVAIALAAGSVPFDGRDGSLEWTATPTPAEPPEMQTPPATEGLAPFAWLAGVVRYLFGGTLVALLLVAAVVVYRTISGTELHEADPGFDRDREPAEFGPTDLDPVGDAAGRAADRLQRDGTLDNEVYRAWKEMTDHLRVANRPARTPGEFADAAELAGMDAEDVRALTTLFESVRYGPADPTEANERRAVDLLRRIESKYETDRE